MDLARHFYNIFSMYSKVCSKHRIRTNNILMMLLLGIIGNVVKSSNSNTLATANISSRQFYQQQQQQQQLQLQQRQQLYNHLLYQQHLEQLLQQAAPSQLSTVRNITSQQTTNSLPLISKIASPPATANHNSLRSIPTIVRDQPPIQYLSPLPSRALVAPQARSQQDVTGPVFVAVAKQPRSESNVIGSLYRGARDSLGGMVNMVASLPIVGGLTSTAVVGLLLAPLVVPDLKRSLAGVTNLEERFGIQGRLESFVSWVERSVEDLPAFPRLHPQECVKRAVCEVNHDRKKYGLPGLILQVMFPPQTEMTDEPSRVVNKYKMAASYGKFNTSDDPDGCKTRYEECIVNLLDIIQNLMGVFLN